VQGHALDSLGQAIGLIPVRGGRLALGDRAEATAARADVAQYQEGGCAALPTLAHVGAVGLFADGVQRLAAHEVAHSGIVLAAAGNTHA
jgi:hypothetical protein